MYWHTTVDGKGAGEGLFTTSQFSLFMRGRSDK